MGDSPLGYSYTMPKVQTPARLHKGPLAGPSNPVAALNRDQVGSIYVIIAEVAQRE